MKLFAYEKYKALSEKNGPTGIARGLGNIIGIAELAGGLGIVLPMATNIAPSSARGRSRTLDHHAAGDWLSPAPPRVAGRARHPYSCWQCLWCSGVFLTGREQGARRCRHWFCPAYSETKGLVELGVTRRSALGRKNFMSDQSNPRGPLLSQWSVPRS